MKTFWMVVSVVILILVGVYLWFSMARWRVETPEYRVLLKDGNFEVREYPPLFLVNTPLNQSDNNGAFGKLFRYISGENKAQQKIAMTTPVMMSRQPNQETMGFIVPQEITKKQVPVPQDGAVQVDPLEVTRFVALRFWSGFSSEAEQETIDQIYRWIETKSYTVTGTPWIAYYDPPWTPFFLRRNEVLIPITSTQ